MVLLELGITENVHVVDTITNIINRVVVMTFLDGRPVQLLKAIIRGLAPTT